MAISKLLERARSTAVITALIGFAFSLPVEAASLFKGAQFHFRTGPLSATLSGKAAEVSGGRGFSVSNTIDLDGEVFTSSRDSYVIRGILAHDLASAQTMYAYMGVGRRFYLWSNGMVVETMEKGTSVTSVPKWRYYVGADAGFARVVAFNYGPVLEVASTLIDIGVHGGAIYQMTKSLGIDLHLGKSMGFGFSSVTVGCSTTRMFLGLSYFF
ncbi:MAG: hypothetical protein H7222_12865 [Methylotenera sp.]|nr:hypothetical protein [Oligoflexia bacterium]